MKQSQTAWVRSQLRSYGRVTRNQALRRYISRLAARIAELRAEGWNIEGSRRVTKHGTDWVYKLVK